MAFTGSDWGRRVKLTGLSPSVTLSGYVAVITLDNIPVEAIDAGANSALNGGGDLRFSTDDAGANQLPCDVVSFVTSSTAGVRQCKVFVRFPTYSSASRDVWMFYKKAGESQPASSSTFGQYATWAGYPLAVVMESTTPTNRVDGAALTSGGVASTTGPLGTALDFTSGYIRCGTDKLGSGDFSISALVRPDTLGGFRGIVGNWDNATSGSGYLGFKDSNFAHNTYSTTSTVSLGAATLNEWMHISELRSGNALTFRKDGIAFGTGTNTIDPLSTKPVAIGGLQNGTSYFFAGKMASVFVRDSNVGVDYDATQSSNLSAPSTFWTVGTPEDAGGVGGAALLGSSSSTATTTAALTTAILLAGSGSGTSSASSSLTTGINLLGDAVATALAIADLTTGGAAAFVGSASASSSASAALTTSILMSGSASGSANVTADLLTAIEFIGSVLGTSSASGVLTAGIPLGGSASGSSSVTAGLSTGIPLAGDAQGVATALGNLSLYIDIAGSAVGSTAALAELTTAILLEGDAYAPSSGSAALFGGTSVTSMIAPSYQPALPPQTQSKEIQEVLKYIYDELLRVSSNIRD